jgi:hypothetical protein
MEILKNLVSKDILIETALGIKSKEKPVGDRLVPNSFSAYALPETDKLYWGKS